MVAEDTEDIGEDTAAGTEAGHKPEDMNRPAGADTALAAAQHSAVVVDMDTAVATDSDSAVVADMDSVAEAHHSAARQTGPEHSRLADFAPATTPSSHRIED
jgi:hypothetical protein